ncbi:MAG: ATP-binding cassette domain-containing protein [Candidatus Competibacteraceae bacterium]|nr:ATP-binding cassette domain-containing protein [Candidatus Competibacteraceae bacterium]
MTESAHIELAGVEVAHETRPSSAVLHSVDWAITPGERWTVGGTRGSGKTSLFYTGAGLIAPAAGMLRAFGQDYWQSNEVERLKLNRRIGSCSTKVAAFSAI